MSFPACRFLAACALSVALILSPAAPARGDDGLGSGDDALPRMPGYWDPVPESGSPSVLSACVGQEIHRPGLQIQPGLDARPAMIASVHERPALYGLASSPYGLQLTALAYGDTIESQVVAPLIEFLGLGDPLGLGFDTRHNTLYAMFSGIEPGGPTFICTIDTETGECTYGGESPPGTTFVGLTYDFISDRLCSVMFGPDGPLVCEIVTSPFHLVYVLDSLPAPGSTYTITDVAIDSPNQTVYVLYWSATTACRLVAYHLDSGLTRTIDLTGPNATEPYKAAFDSCSGRLLFVGRSGDLLYSLAPDYESAPQMVGPIHAYGPSAITFWKPESWGLDYAAYDGAVWSREPIDNQQGGDWDPLWFWGDQRFHTCGSSFDPELGRIDGTAFLYRDDGQPVVAWAQRVDDLFSEILVAARDPHTGMWNPIGANAHGTPSNKLPGISSTFAFATDPKILRARMGGQDTLVVTWLERFESPTSTGEVYARYFDEDAGQWLEMGLNCASGDGLTRSGGRVDSLDAAVLGASNPGGRRILVAYSHDSGDREPIFLRVWDDGFQSWVEFSPGSADSNFGISNPPPGIMDSHPAIAVSPDSGGLFVAWRRQTSDEPWMVMGKQWLGWAIGWVDVGYGGQIHRPAQTAATISHPTATLGKQIVVAWEQDLPTATGKREVLARAWQDSMWQEIGAGSSTSGGISGSYAVESVYPRLVTDPLRHPVLAWDEGGAAYLRRFDQPLTQPGDCNIDGEPDDQTIANCPWGNNACADCNLNGVPDACDMATGYSWDIEPPNGKPDECDPPPRGDLNCNHEVNAGDIPHFVQALVDPESYWATHDGSVYRPCQWMLADMNRDSRVDGADVAGFNPAISSE